MANRVLNQFRYSLEKKMVDIYCLFAVGSSGAPTLNAGASKGVTSVVRNSAGNYTVNFGNPAQNRYVKLLFADSTIFLGTGAPSAGTILQMVIRADNSSSATAPGIVVEFLNSSGTAVDVASGVTVSILFELRDSLV